MILQNRKVYIQHEMRKTKYASRLLVSLLAYSMASVSKHSHVT